MAAPGRGALQSLRSREQRSATSPNDITSVASGSVSAGSPHHGRAVRSRGCDIPPPEESDAGIRVLVRIRPFNQREADEAKADAAAAREEGKEPIPLSTVVETEADCQSCTLLDHTAGFCDKHTFSFDHCFTPFRPRCITFDDDKSDSEDSEEGQGSQESVYMTTGHPALQAAWDGYNACVFAYGQTSSGKTYTMMGTKQEPGIIPRLCRALFERVEEVEEKVQHGDKKKTAKVVVTFMEIYNEQVKDLLRPPDRGPKHYASRFDEKHIGAEYQTLRVRHHPLHGPFVEGITKKDCTSWAHCVQLIRLGTQARQQAATHMNDSSSRSHAIFQLCVTQTEQLGAKLKGEPICSNRTSKINLVDLAGSERMRKTDVKGKHMLEANHINKSLMTLRKVIDTLVANATVSKEHQRLPPYRESLLTWILADNFGGNAKTVMIANVSPYWRNASETESTLRYATTAKGIVNRVRVNEDASAKLIRELQSQVRQLQEAKLAAEAAAAESTGERQRIRELEEEIALSNKAIDELRDREQDLQRMTENFRKAEEELIRDREQWKAKAQKLEGESAALRAALERMQAGELDAPSSTTSVRASSGVKGMFWLDEEARAAAGPGDGDSLTPTDAALSCPPMQPQRRSSRNSVATGPRRRQPAGAAAGPGADAAGRGRGHRRVSGQQSRREEPSPQSPAITPGGARAAGAAQLSSRPAAGADAAGDAIPSPASVPSAAPAAAAPGGPSPVSPEFGRRAGRKPVAARSRDDPGSVAQSAPAAPRRRPTPPAPPSPVKEKPQERPAPAALKPSQPSSTAPPTPVTFGTPLSPLPVRPQPETAPLPAPGRDAIDEIMPPAPHRASAGPFTAQQRRLQGDGLRGAAAVPVADPQKMIAFTEIDGNKDVFDAMFKSPQSSHSQDSGLRKRAATDSQDPPPG